MTLGFVAECDVSVFGDTIGVKASVLPCAKVANMALEITDSKFGINFPIAGVEAGEIKSIDVPGLSVDIPKIGSAGVVIDLGIDGNVDNLELKVGLDACASVLHYNVCGAKLSSKLPIWLLDHTFQFESICDATKNLRGVDVQLA